MVKKWCNHYSGACRKKWKLICREVLQCYFAWQFYLSHILKCTHTGFYQSTFWSLDSLSGVPVFIHGLQCATHCRRVLYMYKMYVGPRFHSSVFVSKKIILIKYSEVSYRYLCEKAIDIVFHLLFSQYLGP